MLDTIMLIVGAHSIRSDHSPSTVGILWRWRTAIECPEQRALVKLAAAMLGIHYLRSRGSAFCAGALSRSQMLALRELNVPHDMEH